MAAVTSLMRAQQIAMARLNELLEPFDLTFPRYEALMLLFYSRRGQLPLGKISDRLQVHRASVTNVIDKLAASGYVERVGHGEDRRAVLALITAAGQERGAAGDALPERRALRHGAARRRRLRGAVRVADAASRGRRRLRAAAERAARWRAITTRWISLVPS